MSLKFKCPACDGSLSLVGDNRCSKCSKPITLFKDKQGKPRLDRYRDKREEKSN